MGATSASEQSMAQLSGGNFDPIAFRQGIDARQMLTELNSLRNGNLSEGDQARLIGRLVDNFGPAK